MKWGEGEELAQFSGDYGLKLVNKSVHLSNKYLKYSTFCTFETLIEDSTNKISVIPGRTVRYATLALPSSTSLRVKYLGKARLIRLDAI